jgi:hypothetical protein
MVCTFSEKEPETIITLFGTVYRVCISWGGGGGGNVFCVV